MTLEKNGQTLVIDPGNITDDFVIPNRTTAIVLTHEHPDHIDTGKIQAIIEQSPDACIVSHQGIIDSHDWPVTRSVKPGERVTIGDFSLEFFGGKHAVIHTSIPIIDNLSVMVDDIFYYPGDSYAIPSLPVKVLAAPTSGPWLKIGDVADFILEIKPELVISTHDAHSSQKNVELVDRMLPMLLGNSVQYTRVSGSIEL